MPNANVPDFSLSDGVVTFDFKIDGDSRIYQQAISEDRALAIDLSSQNKKIGEFDEQNDFRGGRGHENLSKSPEGYYDGQNAWTLNGMLMSGLQWKFAAGLRVGEDFVMPGSVKFVPLYSIPNTTSGFRYQSRSFVAGSTVTGAGYTAAIMGFWLIKVGNPGTATFEITDNGSGSPGTVRTTGTLTAANFPDDGLSHFVEISPTANALTNATTYHIKIYGAATDTKDNHWQVAVQSGAGLGKSSPDNSAWTSRGYGIYFWLASANITRRLFLFQYDGLQYAVTSQSGNSELFVNGARGKATAGASTTLTDSNAAFGTNSRFVGAYVRILRGNGAFQIRQITAHTNTQLTVSPAWDTNPSTNSEYVIFSTPVFTKITGHGLGGVTSRPVVLNGIIYFPQGASTNIRRIRFNADAATPAYEFADDGTNKASFLEVNATGDRIYNITGNTVTSAPEVTWPTNLTFANSVRVGKGASRLNGVNWDENKNALVVYREDQAFSVSASNQVTRLKYNFEDNQSYLHGIAATCANGFTYFNRGHSLVQEYGASCQEIGLSWRGTGLKADRQGYFSALFENQGWVFCALDAYSNVSSVNVYDSGNRSYHEIFEAPSSGKRIRDIQWQTLDETGFNRLWIEMSGYLVYIDFPSLTNNPYYASNVSYQHETVFESAVIDKGTSARLLKHIKEIVAVTENLGVNGSGTSGFVGLDYRVDENLFTESALDWVKAGTLIKSPEDIVPINVSDIFKFRYRLRMVTQNANVPVVVRAIVPSGYARVPYKIQWTAQIVMDKLKVTGKNDPTEFYQWLQEKARSSRPLRLTSEKYPTMNGYNVIVDPPSPIPTAPERSRKPWKGVETLVMQEV